MSHICEGVREPDAKEWDGRKLSKGYIASYAPFEVVNGQGVRCSVYVSGCLMGCPGCFNKKAQSFRFGTPYTQALQDQILDDLSRSYVQGLTMLGGEPMLNTPTLIPLAQATRLKFGNSKDIWCWTGYTFEQLLQDTDDKLELLSYVDVLVDGPFIKSKKRPGLQFRGSSNQRIIDVPASLHAGHVVIWSQLHDLPTLLPELRGNDRSAAEGQG